jgi:hypothetical protein
MSNILRDVKKTMGVVVIPRLWRGEAIGTIFYGGKDIKIVKTKSSKSSKSSLFGPQDPWEKFSP